MSAGIPNYQKLHEIGKLPKSARGNIPMLVQLDAVEKRLEEIKAGVCEDCRENLFGEEQAKDKKSDETRIMITEKCPDCEYTAQSDMKGKVDRILRLHSRKHSQE